MIFVVSTITKTILIYDIIDYCVCVCARVCRGVCVLCLKKCKANSINDIINEAI